MLKDKMTKPANRLLTLILLLQRQPTQKAATLASELGVSVRTIHRYIELLDEIGIPVYTERGPYGGFSLVRGYKMPPLIFSPQEAVAICLGTRLVTEIWGNLYADSAQSALLKLENLLPDDQRSEVTWARRSLVTLGLKHPGLEMEGNSLEKLRQAIRGSHRVDMQYMGASTSEPLERTIDPYAILFRSGLWYVVGYCHRRFSVRTFRLDRIQEMTVSTETFQAPDDFDVRKYWENAFHNLLQVRIKMKFSKEYADIARNNRANWDEFETLQDDSVIVTMNAPDLIWAASSVIAYGPAIEVLEPAELRVTLREWALAISATYASV